MIREARRGKGAGLNLQLLNAVYAQCLAVATSVGATQG